MFVVGVLMKWVGNGGICDSTQSDAVQKWMRGRHCVIGDGKSAKFKIQFEGRKFGAVTVLLMYGE